MRDSKLKDFSIVKEPTESKRCGGNLWNGGNT